MTIFLIEIILSKFLFIRLAWSHVETRFVKINAEKNPFLVERLGILMMPTIVLIKNGKTDHAIHGFDEFGGTDDFTTADCAYGKLLYFFF